MNAFLGGLLGRVAVWVFDRVRNHLKSTGIGIAVGGLVFEVLTTFGCDIDLLNAGLVSAVAAAPGVLGADAGTIAPTLWASMKEGVTEAKHSKEVELAARKAQEEAAKAAGMPPPV